MDKLNNKDNTKEKMKRRYQGVVVSDKPEKTIVVKVDHVRIHRLYKKRYTVSKRYQVHDEKNQFTVGDTVEFTDCRPLSKNKRWRVVYQSQS